MAWQDREGLNFFEMESRPGETSHFGRMPFSAGGRVGQVDVPEWAGSQFSDPESFYDYWQMIPEIARPGARIGIEARGDEIARREQARQDALATLGGASSRMGGLMESFEEDPVRLRIQEALEERTSPDYRVVSEQEEMQRMLEAGRVTNRLVEEARLRAASRGQAYTPVSMEHTGAIRAAGEAGVGRLRTGIAGENEAARMGMADTLNWIDVQIANLEQNVDSVPIDATAFAMLGMAIDQYEEQIELLREGQEMAEEALEPDFWDMVTDVGTAWPGLIPRVVGALAG